MSEDKVYKDGDIVWVKLGNNWWPGEVTGPTRHPEGLVKHLKRVPYCVVKFFNENAYEYVRSGKQIFPFQCAKQKEFIRKGYSLYNSGNSFMEKFPSDVEVAKQLTRRKEASIIINNRPDSIVKAILGQPLIRTCDEYYDGSECREKRRSGVSKYDSVTKILNITTNPNNDSLSNKNSGTHSSNASSLPNDKTKNIVNSAVINNSNYQCNLCDFNSMRLNVMILHRKMHSNRNSVGSNNSTPSRPTNTKSTPAGSGITTTAATAMNMNIDTNQVQQNRNVNKEKNISKTKVHTTTAAGKGRTPSPVKEVTTAVASANKAIDVTETAVILLTPKGKYNRMKKQQGLTEKSKTVEKTADIKQKEENAYAKILSDFCPNETETCPSSEEKQSRRSLRHCKNINENTTGKVSTICIDLSETKTIQKIPKKREYSLLQLQNESSPQKETARVVVAEPDVVCLGDKEKETATIASTKAEAEDIRRMLLADWSDDDETPNEAIVVDDTIMVENAESNECVFAADSGVHTSVAVVLASAPVVKLSSACAGRIRNIPKKDRRDVVLQDFNSLSLMQSDCADHPTKTIAVDLDSSNSSVVEIIEDKQQAPIITINDDEEQMKNQMDLSVTESKDNDTAVGVINDKSASAATSATTLSCFDFQEEEDERDNTTTTISHFKKKYLSGDKLQNLSSATTDELREDSAAKSRAEMAEKDQRLTAEIEMLLEETHPPVSDFNSFEENISVKDLPIKERGKRIFKSRNKTRIEDKTNAEVVPVTIVEVNLPIAAETIQDHKSNANSAAETEILGNAKDGNILETETDVVNELNMIPDQENSINKKCLIEISSQEIPKFLDDKQLIPNENKENEDYLSEKNKECSEVSTDDHNTSEGRREDMEKANARTSDSEAEYINNKKSIENVSKNIENISTEQHENYENKDGSYKQLLNNQNVRVDQQQEMDEENQQQVGFVMVKQSHVATKKIPEHENLTEVTEVVDEGHENISLEDNKQADISPAQPSDPGDAEREDMPVNNVKVSEIQIISQEILENNSAKETAAPTSLKELTFNSQSHDKNLKMFAPEKNDKNRQQCTENIFKIRVKSPDQLFDQAFVMASQQEQELQPPADNNADARLITTTPTDENSSMGASDTGAEFGSPTSMLSEERLPAFRFQSNQTPQQEIETAETELQLCNTSETDQEELNVDAGRSAITNEVKENFPKDKLQIYKDSDQKSLQQRRFSLDLVSLQTEPKSTKRQRLSVDDTATCQENNIEKPQEVLSSFKILQSKSDGKNRPKSRHMKITPRRNVSELFKLQSSLDILVRKVAQKSSSLESVDETQSIENIVATVEKQPLKTDNKIVASNENCSILSNEVLDNITTEKQVDVNPKAALGNIALDEIAEARNFENPTDKEELNKTSKEQQENKKQDELISKTISAEKEVEAEAEGEEEPSLNILIQVENEGADCPTEVTELFNDDNDVLNIESNAIIVTRHKSTEIESTDENIVTNLENIDISPAEIPIVTVDRIEDLESKYTQSLTLPLDSNKAHKDQGLETPYSPGVPPPTPQEREIVIESDNINQSLNTQEEAESNIEGELDMNVFPITPIEKEHSNEIANQQLAFKDKEQNLSDTDEHLGTSKENELLVEEVSPLITLEKETINDSNTSSLTSEKTKPAGKYEILAEPLTLQQPLDIVIKFENSVTISEENNIDKECEKVMPIPSPPHAKDLIMECEPSTPQGIIECDHNIPAQITPEKEIIIESHMVLTNPTQGKDIVIEENLQLEEKETLLAREFQVIQSKESSASVHIPQESQSTILQTDADKAAEEFLIEFDSIVNHSHTAEENVTNNNVEDAINAEDLINNIIEEVHEDQLKQDEPTKSESPVQYEPLTYTVVAPKNSWNQIFKDSFHRQLPPAKRRQTICFEISDTKEGVACKKQAFDFESILPVNKTIKRTAERKLTLPAIETKLSNNHQSHNIFALNHNQLTLNKKLIPTTKRKLSIEDNITSFIIERPKQPANSVSGPPPLQRIRPLSRQGHIISKSSVESLSEPPPLQSNDNLFHELFTPESSSPTLGIEMVPKAEGGRVIHQQIISSPTTSSISQNKAADTTKISKNKQIGVDSRGNKYVIIKTPPTDIVVQPTLTSSTASAVTAANNFGTTITIQPIARSISEVSVTKPTTKSNNIPSSPTVSSRKQQLQQQPMKQISITVPAQSPLEVSNSAESGTKTHVRNRRKASQTKGIIAAATANNNINSAKHRQAMEALSRRLSIASEAPPLAKISRTSTSNVHTQISNNSNITFFGDTQISNIAQQQLMQLQQQQAQTTASPLPPPIILNKNAHQQSVIKRKARKLPHQLQQQQQQSHFQHQQQIMSAKSSQLLQQLQQQQTQVHQQQQQFITQIASSQQQQSQQQHNPLQPPPLQQMQPQTIPMQQQIVQQSDGIVISAAPEDDNVIGSMQLIALPTQPYPGYSETFLLCKVKGNTCKPVDNVPLYLNHQLNELVPVPLEAIEGGHKTQEQQIGIKASNDTQQLLAGQDGDPQDTEGNLQMTNLNCNLVEGGISPGIESDHQLHHRNQQQQIIEECVVDENGANASTSSNQFAANQDVNTDLVPNNGILLNIEGQQVLLDAATFAHLLANPDANTQLISDDGTEYVLTHEVLAALQLQQEQQQALELANAAAAEQQQQQQQLEQAGGSDIIAVALASSELYDNDVLTIDTSQGMQLIDGDNSIVFSAQTGTITQQHLTPPAVVTNAVLDQSPIMSTLEVPSSIATAHKLQGTQIITVPSHHLASSSNAALGLGRSNLEDSLAAIGVTTQSSNIPSSLGLPITVTNPNIASKVTSVGPLNEMLQFVSHRPATAAATAAAVAAAALAGESRIFTD